MVGKRFLHFGRMRHPQFYVSGKRAMDATMFSLRSLIVQQQLIVQQSYMIHEYLAHFRSAISCFELYDYHMRPRDTWQIMYRNPRLVYICSWNYFIAGCCIQISKLYTSLSRYAISREDPSDLTTTIRMQRGIFTSKLYGYHHVGKSKWSYNQFADPHDASIH